MRNHILLPALQFAAAAFFAKAALAAPTADNSHTDMDNTGSNTETYCIDASHRIVDPAKCEDAAMAGEFTTVQGPPGLEIGSVHAPMRRTADDGDMVSGGFGEVEQRDGATSTTSSRGSRPTGS